MDFLNYKEKLENNDFNQMMDKMYKISQVKKKISSKGIKKNLTTDEDRKIENYVTYLLCENNIKNNQILNIPLTSKYSFDGNLFSYAIQKINKNENDNLYLIHSLKFYDTFNNLLIKILNDEEKVFLFNQILSKIKIEEKQENDILFKIGENSEKFYFLLNGSATKLIPNQYDIIMDKYEYFIFMKYLYKLDEIELFNLTLVENEEVFDKYELLHFILEDKNIKLHRNVIKQLKNMEASYVSQRLNAIKLNDTNFNNEKSIILSGRKKKLEDVLKGDYVTSCLDEHIKKIKVPVEEYINNLKPINFEEENDDFIKRRITLYLYKIEDIINVGKHLEELEEHKTNKRTSTVICNSHCILGNILKKDYYSCIKVTQTKFHRNDITFLLENELFSTLSFADFDRNYYHLFELTRMHQNQLLFHQREKSDYIYFLKHGEMSVSLEGNINDLYRIIGLKGGPKNRKLLDVNFIKRFYSVNLDNNIFEKNNNFALLKINENFPIGLEDFLDEENEYCQLFNVYCNMDSEVLAIKNDHLNEIVYREIDVFKIKEKYITKRKNLLIEKLNSLKNGLIQKYLYEKYKIKAILPDLFEETALLSPKRIKNPERFVKGSPRRKNDLLYIDTKFNGKSYIEITTAIKLRENKELYPDNNDQSENQKNNNSEEQENKNNNNSNINETETSKNFETIINENIKTDDNINNNNTDIERSTLNVNSTGNINKFRKKKVTVKMPNMKENSLSKVNKEILELIRSPNFNQIIRLNKNKKIELDPLDKIYKHLKYPSITNSRSIKNFPKNNIGYEITSFNVLTPLKPHKFIPNNRKIILPQHPPIHGYFSKKMKEIKLFKTISQDKSSVILKTETNPHDLYFDRNNKLIATINFQKHKSKDKNRLIFNNIKINHSINYKVNQSLDKKSLGTNTEDNSKKNNDIEKTLMFPKINNISINRNIN